MSTKQLPIQQRIANRIQGILTCVMNEYNPKKQVYLKDIYDKNSSSENKSPAYIKKNITGLRKLSQNDIDSQIQEGKILIVIEDLVYDISSWEFSHPGGKDILHTYKGTDATEQFFAFHRPRVANRLEQFLIGQVEQKRVIEKTEQQYKSLRKYLWENDYFSSNNEYYDKKYFVIILMFLGALILALNQNSVLSAIMLGLFLKQSAFIAHDSLHYGILPQSPGKKFNLHGMFFGSVIFGISSDMWSEEHTMHHAITRRPMEDPQFNYLPVFLISEKEITWKKYKIDTLARILISIQHYSFIPIAMVVGRFNIYLISLISIMKTGQFLNLIGMAMYFTWYTYFVCIIDGFWPRLIFVIMNHAVSGILHVQLLINHLAVDAFTTEEERQMDFFTFQMKTTRNVISQWWSHWFHGGLQWQIEHHLFPQLPRHNLPLVTPVVKEICHQNGIEYNENGFWETLNISTNSMRDLANQIIRGELG